MRIPLDRESQSFLYEQIENFLRKEIQSGALASGTRLPSTRNLAQSLGVNRITVSTAYAGLESEGLLFSKLGSGTYVASLFGVASPPHAGGEPVQDWPLWQSTLIRRTWLPTDQVREQLGMGFGSSNGHISFAFGEAPVDLFPTDEFRWSLNDVLRRDQTSAMGYGDRAGYLPLRATIVHILASQGILTRPEEILITSGSTQAISLVAHLLLRPGDAVLVESPTYANAIDLFTSLDVHLIGVEVDEQGMQVERVEHVLRTHHPELIYTIPTFHNPTGTCLSAPRRRQLVALAQRYNIPILEDEFVGDLRYEGRALPALKTLDPGGCVIYTSTFSKMLMPGLRVGYLVASGPVYQRLLAWKRVTDLATSNLMQRALDAYITVGRYQAHLNRARRIYRRRRDAMLDALRQAMPPGTSWLTPQGGFFVWLKLPPGVKTGMLFPLALEEGVDFAPGNLYFAHEMGDEFLRLNFTFHPSNIIEEGVRRLGKALNRCIR